VCLAMLQALVATVDSIDAFTLLHAMAPMSFDASRLIDMACIAFAGLTMDQIQALRKAYRTTVVASKHVRWPLPRRERHAPLACQPLIQRPMVMSSFDAMA
jgi:hypothetical protein